MKKEYLKIGDVVWANFKGEYNVQNGVRPAIIVQNDKGNYYSPTVVVIPLTSRKTKAKLPTHVEIPANIAGLTKDSIVQCEGIRTISKEDIISVIGHMPNEYMAKISMASIWSTPMIKYLEYDEILYVYKQVLAS